MTVVTLFTAAAFVKIVVCMATETCILRNRQGLIHVAVGTGDFHMITYQRIVGRVVVEGYLEPIRFIVAIGAFCAEALFVNIVLTMTTDAVTRGITMFVRWFVTVGTLGIDMFAAQLEVGKKMIEC
jgi:hypothetical protein